MIVQRRKFLQQLAFFKVNEKTIIRIQAKWKGKTVCNGDIVPLLLILSVVFIHLLVISGVTLAACLQRRKFKNWLADMKAHEEQAIVLQKHYKGLTAINS